jgi:hypothetical protein
VKPRVLAASPETRLHHFQDDAGRRFSGAVVQLLARGRVTADGAVAGISCDRANNRLTTLSANPIRHAVEKSVPSGGELRIALLELPRKNHSAVRDTSAGFSLLQSRRPFIS